MDAVVFTVSIVLVVAALGLLVSALVAVRAASALRAQQEAAEERARAQEERAVAHDRRAAERAECEEAASQRAESRAAARDAREAQAAERADAAERRAAEAAERAAEIDAARLELLRARIDEARARTRAADAAADLDAAEAELARQEAELARREAEAGESGDGRGPGAGDESGAPEGRDAGGVRPQTKGPFDVLGEITGLDGRSGFADLRTLGDLIAFRREAADDAGEGAADDPEAHCRTLFGGAGAHGLGDISRILGSLPDGMTSLPEALFGRSGRDGRLEAEEAGDSGRSDDTGADPQPSDDSASAPHGGGRSHDDRADGRAAGDERVTGDEDALAEAVREASAETPQTVDVAALIEQALADRARRLAAAETEAEGSGQEPARGDAPEERSDAEMGDDAEGDGR